MINTSADNQRDTGAQRIVQETIRLAEEKGIAVTRIFFAGTGCVLPDSHTLKISTGTRVAEVSFLDNELAAFATAPAEIIAPIVARIRTALNDLL
ncbi:hypothetical protein GURASL_05600 [Geotalea uraniireducens]|uniref:Uncharacterized protein n=1 Tax=Geotalea uraniireducens TaxID=351604 RepID=A0ABM8EGW8_9BACT|nr:hypothetical protein [Geotalea uraniireducens]BDV41637.1 hypothetical protein GURASL_05600 [Geotalea uraniireducens]